ncbi:MAG: hypothetical protein ACLQG3_12250 [Terracidiphilus sp.]
MPVLNRELALVPRGARWEETARRTEISAGPVAHPEAPGREAARRRRGLLSTCSNPRCDSGWLRLWRRRDVPVFEGGWCCSEACTAARIASALGREMDGRGTAGESHRHRVPLGLAMLEQGWITQADLRAALAAQKAAGGGRLGGWLVRQRRASEERVTRALGLQWGCPVLDMDFHNPEGLTVLVPRLFVDAFGALPLRVAAGKILYLGFEDHLDPALALAVERITGLEVESGMVGESAFRPAHSRMLEARYPAVELIEAGTEPALAKALAKAVERTRPVEARLARVHECLWLRMWLKPQGGPLPEPDSVRDVIGSAAAH